MLPPIKDTISNQYSTRVITQQDPILPPLLSIWSTGHKPFIDYTHFSNPTENKHNDATDNSCIDNKDYMKGNNLNKDGNKDNECKEDDSESHKSDGSVINKTELEISLTDCWMSTNFPIKFIQYMMGKIRSCEQNMEILRQYGYQYMKLPMKNLF